MVSWAEVVQGQARDLVPASVGDVDEQEPKRVAVAGDRVRAGVEFGGQVTAEERGDEIGERGRGGAHRAASVITSPKAFR